MKKIGIIFIMILLASCMTDEEKVTKRKKTYYLNEDFVLVDKKEDSGSINGDSFKFRIWVLHRVNSPYDSVCIGEIKSRVTEPEPRDGSCVSNFYITNELWYNKEIGDILHFDYIRKNRFFNIHKSKITKVQEDMKYASDNKPLTIPESVSGNEGVGNLEKSRQILEIERQIMALQRELETLKE